MIARLRSLPVRWSRVATFALLAWFATLSAMRLAVLAPAPFTDVHLYLRGTAEWLRGGDPWSVHIGTVYYAAAPPSLLPFVPFALLPEDVATVVLLALGVAASLWTLRRLGLPLWWILWPPLVDNLANGNPQIFLVPLLIGAASWLAPIVKAYAVVPLVIGLRLRALAIAAIAVAVTVPFLPWPAFLARLSTTASLLSEQSQGGMSAWMLPIVLVPVAVVAIVAMGRARATWWFIPALWPSTQWYYSLMALPALTPIAAAILAVPIQGAPVIGAAAVAAEVWWRHRGELAAGWLPDARRRWWAPVAWLPGSAASRRP